jgi:hypothetical protein
MEATRKVWRVRELRKPFILIVCTVYFWNTFEFGDFYRNSINNIYLTDNCKSL